MKAPCVTFTTCFPETRNILRRGSTIYTGRQHPSIPSFTPPNRSCPPLPFVPRPGSPFPPTRPRLLSRTELLWEEWGACPTSPLRRDTLNTSTTQRARVTYASLSTLDNSKLIPPNWLAGVPPRDPRMHAIIHARIYTRVFGIVDHVNSVHAARIPTASDYIRERIRGRTFCPFRFGK